MNCSQLIDLVRGSSLAGWDCVEEGALLRFATPLRYPDNGIIEIFVELRDGRFIVTDFGEAFRFLESHGLDPLRSPTRQKAIEFATRLAEGTLDEGVLEIPVSSPSEVLAASMRMAQLVTRVADLSLLAKGALTSTFSDTVEEFLKLTVPAAEITRGAVVRGSAATHQVDLLVKTFDRLAVVASLAAVTHTGANAQTAFTIQKFADIAAVGASAPDRYTVLDDSADVWSDSLRKQLSRFSDVMDWEMRNELALSLGRAAG